MKKFLTIIAIATFSLGVGAIASAQDAGPQGGQLQSKAHGGGGGLMMMMKIQKEVLADLHLTDDQTKKIADLNKSTMEQVKAMRKANKDNTDKTAMQQERKDLMKKYSDTLKGILTPEEFKTYHQEMRDKIKAAQEAKKDKAAPPQA